MLTQKYRTRPEGNWREKRPKTTGSAFMIVAICLFVCGVRRAAWRDCMKPLSTESNTNENGVFADAALRYDKKWNDFRIAAGIGGWSDTSEETNAKEDTEDLGFGLSFAVRHDPTGLDAGSECLADRHAVQQAVHAQADGAEQRRPVGRRRGQVVRGVRVRRLFQQIERQKADAAGEHDVMMMQRRARAAHQLERIGNDVHQRAGHQRSRGECQHEGAVGLQPQGEQASAEGHRAGATGDEESSHTAGVGSARR